MSTAEIFKASCSVEATSIDPVDVFSNFGDATCGEPARGQHIILDFTPDPVIDNEIVQQKICDFWNFVNNMPDIQNLKVEPTKCEKPPQLSTTPENPDLFKPQSEDNVVDMTKTACSVLEVVEENGLITRAFEARMPHTTCSLGLIKEEDIQKKKKAHRGINCKCTKPCKHCPVQQPAPSKLQKLCTKLEQWDAAHPKSMDPPGHPPAVQHCIIQKQVIEF